MALIRYKVVNIEIYIINNICKRLAEFIKKKKIDIKLSYIKEKYNIIFCI